MRCNKVIMLLLLVVASVATLQAQQAGCREIVLPMFDYNESVYAAHPTDKIDWYCAFSRNTFFTADEAPEDAVVYDISELHSRKDGERVSQDFVVNLDEMSFYAYDFDTFRYRHYRVPVYFRTPASAHPYLVIRTYDEAMRITNEEMGQ